MGDIWFLTEYVRGVGMQAQANSASTNLCKPINDNTVDHSYADNVIAMAFANREVAIAA